MGTINKLLKIDQYLIAQHIYLEKTDHCYFLGEYASRQGYNHSPMNQLIFNFKKPVTRKNHSDWSYKQQAIKQISTIFVSLSVWSKLRQFTWIPIPPSHTKSHPDYDNRLLQLLHEMQLSDSFDMRDMLSIKNDREAAHLTLNRPSIEEHLANLTLDPSQFNPTPQSLIIFDDVIASGAGFKAAQNLLQKQFPNTNIVGIFIARNIPS
ncbi:MAG: hypothetical protein KIT27_03125 [Legionellales bacterium]|nr:hypothetical protein [Legionellales bacterium]